MKAKLIMNPNPMTLRPTDTVATGADYILKHRLRHVPVVDEQGRYVGTFSIYSLLRLALPKAVIMDELTRDPKLGRKMIASLSMRLHHLITDVESYSLHSGRQRIIGYLLRDNPEPETRTLTVTLPTSKGTIASRLNLTQEHFSRILHELSEAGLIVVEGRKITIQDVEKLRGYDL